MQEGFDLVVHQVLEVRGIPILPVALLGKADDALDELASAHRACDAGLLLRPRRSHEYQLAVGPRDLVVVLRGVLVLCHFLPGLMHLEETLEVYLRRLVTSIDDLFLQRLEHVKVVKVLLLDVDDFLRLGLALLLDEQLRLELLDPQVHDLGLLLLVVRVLLPGHPDVRDLRQIFPETFGFGQLRKLQLIVAEVNDNLFAECLFAIGVVDHELVQAGPQIRAINVHIMVLLGGRPDRLDLLIVDHLDVLQLVLSAMLVQQVAPPIQLSALVCEGLLATLKHGVDHLKAAILNQP